MKILFYNHTGQVSGAERVLEMILNGIDRARYDCVVACPEKSRLIGLMNDTGERTRGLRLLEARFTWRPDRLVRYLLSFVQVIRDGRALVKEEAPDVVHANSIRAGIVMAAATIGLRVPVIWHAHDILPQHPLSTLVRLFAAASSRNRIVAVSNAVAERFRGSVLRPFAKRVPIRVVHNAVDLEKFQPNKTAGSEARARLGLTNAQPVVGIVGQLTPRKGQLELIESFADVVRQIPEAVLLIVGEPLFNRDEEYAEQLQETVGSLGMGERIRFLGARNDVPQLIQAMDVLVVNSQQEPFALTVLEGLASGIAVLATAVGGTPEMISDGDNGCLVPRCDNEALARMLVTLLQDDQRRAQLGRNARRSAIACFSIDRFIREIDSLYSELNRSADQKLTHQILDNKLALD
ncbi:MAG TPA: glycosyltransferase family 4 protein [Pyrinomonadaceae bacterium]|jgi:glycosyltransferase involved in cell wall biosynthesis